jgi:membrane fusion protein, multidrug efflux system
VRLTAAIPNQEGRLVGGLFAEGRAATESRTGTVVPSSAVDVRGLRPMVVLLKGGVAEKQEVELGLRDEHTEQVEVTRGVVPGDTLLLGAAMGISPKTPVRVERSRDSGLGIRDSGSAQPAGARP